MSKVWTILFWLLIIIGIWVMIKPAYTRPPVIYDMPEGYEEFQGQNPNF